MKFFKNNIDKPWLAGSIAICTGVILYLLLTYFGNVLHGLGALYKYFLPVIIGLIIAYILNAPAKIIQHKIFRRHGNTNLSWYASVVITIILVIALMIIFGVALIPQIIGSVITWFSNIDSYAAALERLIGNLDLDISGLDIDLSSLASFGQNIVSIITDFLSRNSRTVINTVTHIGGGVFNGVISFIMAIYFLTGKENSKKGFGNFMRLVFSEERYAELADFWGRCNAILIRYIWFDLIDAVIVGVANAVFMGIMRMPMIPLISVLVAVCNLAPTFGPTVGCIAGAIILVLVDPLSALWFILFTLALQMIDGYVIKPRLFGDSLGVPAIWILIMIIVCGRMFGVIGILMAIPLAAILDYLYHDYVLTKLRKRKEQQKILAMDKESSSETEVPKEV